MSERRAILMIMMMPQSSGSSGVGAGRRLHGARGIERRRGAGGVRAPSAGPGAARRHVAAHERPRGAALAEARLPRGPGDHDDGLRRGADRGAGDQARRHRLSREAARGSCRPRRSRPGDCPGNVGARIGAHRRRRPQRRDDACLAAHRTVRPRPTSRFCCREKPALGKGPIAKLYIGSRSARRRRLSPSTARRFPPTSPRASCSATRMARSPVRRRRSAAASPSPITARCSSTKSARSPSARRPSS